VQVGGDASGLELRMLGHSLSMWDGGAYAREVVEGDIHTLNQQAGGLETRDQAKTVIYAVAGGLGTWLIGRDRAPDGSPTPHIGASSLIFGLVAYLVLAGFLARRWRTFFVALLVFLVFGGIYVGVLPQDGPISWEGHLSGAVAGVVAAVNNHGQKRGRR
jgi:hypothetical protein